MRNFSIVELSTYVRCYVSQALYLFMNIYVYITLTIKSPIESETMTYLFQGITTAFFLSSLTSI